MSLVYDHGNMQNTQSVGDSSFRLKQYATAKRDTIGQLSKQMGLGMDSINAPYELNFDRPKELDHNGEVKKPFDDFVVDHSALTEQQQMFEQFKAKQSADAIETQGYTDLANKYGNMNIPKDYIYDMDGTYDPSVAGSNKTISISDHKGGIINVVGQRRNGQMYNSYTGLSGNKNFRNNNWFNITGAGTNTPRFGAVGYAHSPDGDKGDRKMLVFKSPQDGARAGYKLLSGSSYNRGNINKMFAKYQTAQGAHERNMNKMHKAGIPVHHKSFNQLSKDQQITFMNMMVAKEGNVQGGKVTWDMIFG